MNPEHHNNQPFHPLVNRWFNDRIGQPTPIQQRAWSLIAANHHVLVTAPTGSGKTLAAFLWALDQLIRQRWDNGCTRILYISPLKALNNDIQRNLIQPLSEIRERFVQAGADFPSIRVVTRSGDTASHERRRMIRQPPEVLITTPESLHLLLSSQGGRSILDQLRTVILDEIHAVVGSKRGTLLMSSVDRLVSLSGEFQRIALSATVKPVATVAAFIGGYTADGDPASPVYVKRPVKSCQTGGLRHDEIHVRIPDALLTNSDGRNLWSDLADRFRTIIEHHRSTIIFTNSRRLCEKLTFLINADRSNPVAYAHHGSLSRELRLEVEQRLKNGELKAIVATASLELGIDIGALDHVILVQSPSSISSTVQRIGRSGHRVGETSRASFYATHATDLVTSAVLARAAREKDIEPVRPVDCPLDVLAQVVVSMTGIETWDLDRLYNFLRACYPFRNLQRRAFDLTIEMLAGRYSATRIAVLQPKIAVDRLDNTVSARKGALLTLYTSGGVIPDRGYFELRHQDTGARIGELDEEFVWEAKKGQRFTLGTQNWQIQRITHNDVFVRPAKPKAPAPPFWRAEDIDRNYYLSRKIGEFLETAQQELSGDEFLGKLVTAFHLDEGAARYLVEFLKRQQRNTGCALPHRHHVVVESLPSGGSGVAAHQVVVHTFWGGRVNRPFALALEAAYEARYGHAPSAFVTNDAIYLLLPEGSDTADIMNLVSSETVEALLRRRLTGSGVFGARFRECAARALLLPRRHFKQRMPLWLTRQKAQRLLDALHRFNDFPIILEAWRTCLQDDFDMPALMEVLQALEDGQIVCSQIRGTSPSPMALSGSWRQINWYMYADDRQPGQVKGALSPDLLDLVVYNRELRPAVAVDVVKAFQNKRQRLAPGYAPDTPVEILEWVKERLLIPADEWEQVLRRAASDGAGNRKTLLDPIQKKLVRLIPADRAEATHHLIVALEMAPAIAGRLYAGRIDLRWRSLLDEPVRIDNRNSSVESDATPTAADILSQWLRFYGPVTDVFICRQLAIEPDALSVMLAELIETRAVISGDLVRGERQHHYCDADNFETLLRMARRGRAPAAEPLDISDLALALAQFQGLTRPVDARDGLVTRLQPLLCLALSAGLWESEILPARLASYQPAFMDRLIRESGLIWIGRKGRKVAFCHEDDLDLMTERPSDERRPSGGTQTIEGDVAGLFPDHRGRYPLSALLGDPPRPARQVLARLWSEVWEGRVTNDAMPALRRGMAGKHSSANGPSSTSPPAYAFRVNARRRRRPAVDLPAGAVGNWRLIEPANGPAGLLEEAEILKDRARLLLDRYGILFRQILAKELAPFQWRAIFRALRLMELSGEIIAGCFFDNLPGLQFVSPRMLRTLGGQLDRDCVYWMCAQDPASICGLGIGVPKDELPRRSAGSHLVYLGNRLAMVSTRYGKDLRIHLPLGHKRAADLFILFDHLLGRSIDPLKSITVETVNASNAAESPFVEVLRQRFDILVEAPKVFVYRSVTSD